MGYAIIRAVSGLPSSGGTAQDKSIGSLSGASQTACALNGNRRFLEIQNTGNANIGVNYSGQGAAGTAAVIGGTGTMTITPTGSIRFDKWVPQNTVNVIGTTGQPVSIIEG